MEDKRLMQCPFCGHQKRVGGIGAAYCGPHKIDEYYFRAYRMVEIEAKDAKEADHDHD